jgi:SAM-dependent methyltransferase
MEKSSPSNVHRTHDEFYLGIPANNQPKDSFKTTAELLEKLLGPGLAGREVLDAGCAVGHFPHYLGTRFPEASVEGLEYLPQLITKGKELFPDVTIRHGSIFDENPANQGRFDAITMLGVLQIFDDIAPVISNLASWLKRPGGLLLVHGLFNPYDFDVFTRYRKAGEGPSGELENGWNIVSQRTFADVCQSAGAQSIIFHKFDISVDIAPTDNDPLRSWTEKSEHGHRQIVNGLHIRQPQYIAEVIF